MLQELLARLAGLRLQRILLIGFVLTTAITILIGTPITYSVINRYLAGAQEERLGRDMKLAESFYDLKLKDISSTAQRVSSSSTMQADLASASRGDPDALQAVEQELKNESAILVPDTHRFIVAVDSDGNAVVGQVASNRGRSGLAIPGTNWALLPMVKDTLLDGQARTASEVVPAEILQWLGLEAQARIALVDTPNANPVPFDYREGTAGLTVVSVAPVQSPSGELIGAVLVGHLFNNDFTLVDRIKEVAGVDTSTIFLGDLRVSTNVLDEKGERAIGTRVSRQVYDKVLAEGEEYTGRAFVVNQWFITRYKPLRDHLGQVVGILYVGAKEASFVQLVDSFRRQLLLIGGASILLAILIAIPVAWSISRPLADMAQATHKVAEGDWSVRVPVYGRGEMGTLGASFNTMVGTLRDTNDQLVQKEKLASLGQLAAGVAHEINNPLGSVLLYADILCRETPPDNTQQREDLAMIIKEATRCKTIVTDLLNFSRQNEVLAQKTDIKTLLQELADELGRKELYARIRLNTELEPALPLIEADPLQLRQAFLNLLNNAAEAMPNGGELTLRAHKGPSAGTVTVEVHDTGTGISEENMKKIFTPFFTTKPIGKGTGLGLAITYGIVKMHQGQITVQSQVGQGTTFTITLRERLLSQNKGTTVLP
jgi:two-component system, NtrC family, sensor kinase